jgi:hypothetical protein
MFDVVLLQVHPRFVDLFDNLLLFFFGAIREASTKRNDSWGRLHEQHPSPTHILLTA